MDLTKFPIHISALSFNCPHCDFTATSKLSLTSHVRKSHSTSTNKFNCLYCNFTCKWEGALTAHVNKKHSNAKAIRYGAREVLPSLVVYIVVTNV